jgi:hypothetical protein
MIIRDKKWILAKPRFRDRMTQTTDFNQMAQNENQLLERFDAKRTFAA